MTMNYNIANLFRSKQAPAVQSATTVFVNEDVKKQDETYVYYGTRICGKVTASLPALSAFLPRVFNAEKQRQIDNEEIQQQHREKLQKKLNEVENKITDTKAIIDNIKNRLAGLNDDIAVLKEKLIEAKNLHGEVNKMAKVKLIIGITILFFLTLYLIIFYSSTFYSAFFKPFDIDVSVGDAMFDSHAIPNAIADGLGELMFILCAPIIFMGLGYGLHYFMQQKSWTKYLKSGCILVITFIFDCILAYLIAKKIYDIESITKWGDYPEFNLSMAVQDINVWAVIFCGFIVYLIWGIVFDMTMTAYEDLRSNQKEIMVIETNIRTKKDQVIQENDKLTANEAAIVRLERERQSIITDMSKSIYYDVQIIKTALSDFFTGWMTMMNGLSQSTEQQNEANRIYKSTIEQLFN